MVADDFRSDFLASACRLTRIDVMPMRIRAFMTAPTSALLVAVDVMSIPRGDAVMLLSFGFRDDTWMILQA